MLVNAGSLVGTTTVTSVLGFAYWWLAARRFPPAVVGFGSAAISAMTLIGTGCILGLGTLLVGELPRQKGKEMSLISAALILVGGVGSFFGVAFALVAPFVSADFQPLRATVQDVLLFAVGVGLTAITIVLDQALIGLLRGELQLWRNIFFSVVKLVALFGAGLWLLHNVGMIIYATWAGANALSLAVLTGIAVSKGGWSIRDYLPEWGLLRKLGPAALQHHMLNLIMRVPTLTLPVLVTVLLSATMNAWFYVSFMIANFVFSVPVALTIVLYATNSAQPSELARKTRLTLGLSVAATVLASVVLLFGTQYVLSLFGHTYAEQAAWSLRILALGAFPLIIKNHYIGICRIYGRLMRAMLPIATGSLLELGIASLGARIGGLSGLSLGWILALSMELVFMAPTVYKVVWPKNTSAGTDQAQQSELYREGTHSQDNQARFSMSAGSEEA
jgi:O-antigen/teichoic acid export membrane protein